MPSPRALSIHRLFALAAAMALASCGGGSAAPPVLAVAIPGAPPPATDTTPPQDDTTPPQDDTTPTETPSPPPPPPTTLAASVSSIALAASGKARSITITNTGTADAHRLRVRWFGPVADTSFDPAPCSAPVPPSESRTFTFTPGATPTATPGDQSPPTALLEFDGDNTNVVEVALSVIGYGSVHQGGYVFGIDDSTPDTGSIGGKIVALADEQAFEWSDGENTAVPSINEDSTTPCEGAVDGACNTQQISKTVSVTTAADQCRYRGPGWYLPAICELGYSPPGSVYSFCGSEAAPRVPDNLQSRLMSIVAADGSGDIAQLAGKSLHSSTQSSSWSAYYSHIYRFYEVPVIDQAVKDADVLPIRCARAFTP